jgi:hypothetical protein
MIDGEARKDFTLRTSDPDGQTEPKMRLSATAFASDTPPSGDFLFLLPRYIEGFHMQEKKWSKLMITVPNI